MGMEDGPKADDCQGGEGNITEAQPVGERAGLESSRSVSPCSKMSPVPVCSAVSHKPCLPVPVQKFGSLLTT